MGQNLYTYPRSLNRDLGHPPLLISVNTWFGEASSDDYRKVLGDRQDRFALLAVQRLHRFN
jgi:hypothetical protein